MFTILYVIILILIILLILIIIRIHTTMAPLFITAPSA